MNRKRLIEDKLKELLAYAYHKGQAYYKFDNYNDHGDERQDWDNCAEPDYQEAIKDFLILTTAKDALGIDTPIHTF